MPCVALGECKGNFLSGGRVHPIVLDVEIDIATWTRKCYAHHDCMAERTKANAAARLCEDGYP